MTRTIDLATWSRREHFAFFRRADLPFYNVTARIDVTGIRAFATRNRLSLSHVLTFFTVKALNAVENFRYRVRGETVVLHDRLTPSFAYLRDAEELFRMITVDFDDDLATFDRRCKEAIRASQCYFDVARMKDRDDFVFISSLPWIAFTGVDHTLSLRRDDAIPRVSWGKIEESNERELLPYNIQANHMFVDGLHVGRFFEEIQRLVSDILAREEPSSPTLRPRVQP